MTRSDEPDVARLYHEHSYHERSRSTEMTLDGDREPDKFRVHPGALRVPLPGRDFAVDEPLGAVLARRRSVRDFDDRTMPLEALGRLLHASCGVRAVTPELLDRPMPSAGGKHPLEVYLSTRAVSGLADGLYHYDPQAHELELCRVGLAQPTLAHIALDQPMVASANVVVVLTAIPERTRWKYGQRGYRYLWLDAGHLGQNLYLVATALGLGPCGIGGFHDRELIALLDLPEDELPFYLVCIGQEAAR